MGTLVLATVKPGNVVLHTVPGGNRHSLCGLVAECHEDIWAVAPLVVEGTRRLCKNCARVKPARDTSRPVDPSLSEPTDTWTVTNRAGEEITRVYGTTMGEARNKAREYAEVLRVSTVEGGFSLRRLTQGQLKAPRV